MQVSEHLTPVAAAHLPERAAVFAKGHSGALQVGVCDDAYCPVQWACLCTYNVCLPCQSMPGQLCCNGCRADRRVL